jgi:polyisoprenoid-binding protein YceI
MASPSSDHDLPLWTLDPELSRVAFSAQHLGAPWVEGEFTHVTGKLKMASDQPLTAICWGELDTRQLVPGRPRFNTQARAADFLDPEHHPKIAFAGRLRAHAGERSFKADAEITIRSWTQRVVMDVDYLGERCTPYRVGHEDRGQLTRVALRAHARLTREELTASLRDRPAEERVVVASHVHITLVIEAILDADLHSTGAIELLQTAQRR